MEKENFYERLGLTLFCLPDEIKAKARSFRVLLSKYHPDKVYTNKLLYKIYTEIQQLIGEAILNLEDPKSKERYDKQLKLEGNLGVPGSDGRTSSSYNERTSSSRQDKPPSQSTKFEFIDEEIELMIEIYSSRPDIIHNRMDEYIRRGADKNKLLTMVEKAALVLFCEYIESNSHRPDIIHKRMDEYIQIGVDKNKLLAIVEKAVLVHFSEYIKIYSSIPDMIHNKMDEYIQIGVDKNKLEELMRRR